MPLPSMWHPIWEKLITGEIKHTFSLFAANLAVEHAVREYQSNASKKLHLARELHEFFSAQNEFTQSEIEPLL